MSLIHSPNIVTNGLVFYLDSYNKKSWVGAPSTNLLKRSGAGDLDVAVDLYGKATKTSLGNGKYRFVNNGTGGSTVRLYVNQADLTNGASYGVSVYYEELVGSVDLDWCDVAPSSGNYNTTFTGDNKGRLTGVASRGTYDSTFRFLDINISSGSSVTLYQAQVDSAPQVTPYITGTRSNTEAVKDLTGRYSVTASNLTYNTDGSYSFNGSSSSINVANVDLRSDWTLEAWFKTSGSNAHTLFGHGTTASNQGLHITGGTTTRFGMYANDTDYPSNPTPGVWYQYTFTYQYASPYTKQMFINGVKVTGTVAAGPGQYAAAAGDLRIGATYGSGSYGFHTGQIGVVKMYNRVLTDDNVLQNFNVLKGRYGL